MDNERLSCTTPQLSELNRLQSPTTHWLMCLHTRLYSLTPPGKKYHSKVTCQGTNTKAKARIWRPKGVEKLRQTGSTAEYSQRIQHEEMMPKLLCAVIIWGKCSLSLYNFRSLLEDLWKQSVMISVEHSPIAKGFPLNAARNISGYAAALHVYFNLLGNLFGGTPSKRKEQIWGLVRTELVMLAGMKQ